MKTILFALTIALCGLSGVRAEGPDPKSENRRGPGDMRMKTREKFLENLPPEARQRFEAAREKALQDPAVQELRKKSETANREFFDAMRKKMLEIDPSLGEIVKNARGGGKGAKEMREDRREGGREPGGFGDLTDAEKEKLMAAREKAKADPAVAAAEKLKGQAATPEDRRAASEEFRKAMHTALLKADPTLGPILEKMVPKVPPAPPVPGGDGEMMTNP